MKHLCILWQPASYSDPDDSLEMGDVFCVHCSFDVDR